MESTSGKNGKSGESTQIFGIINLRLFCQTLENLAHEISAVFFFFLIYTVYRSSKR